MKSIHRKDTHLFMTSDISISRLRKEFDKRIESSIREGNWLRLWDDLDHYLQQKRKMIKSFSSLMDSLPVKPTTQHIEKALQLLSNETAHLICLAIIYNTVVMKKDEQKGKRIFKLMKTLKPCTLQPSDYTWYMVVKCELSGIRGIFKIFQERHDNKNLKSSLTFIQIAPLLLDLCKEHSSIRTAIVRYMFISLRAVIEIHGIFEIEEPLMGLVNDLITIKYTDISIWSRLLHIVEYLNGTEVDIGILTEESSPNPVPEAAHLFSILLALNWELGGNPDVPSIMIFIQNVSKGQPLINILRESQSYFQQIPNYGKLHSLITMLKVYEHLRYHDTEQFKLLLKQIKILIHEVKTNHSPGIMEFIQLVKLHTIGAVLAHKLNQPDKAHIHWDRAWRYKSHISDSNAINALATLAWGYLLIGRFDIAKQLINSMFVEINECMNGDFSSNHVRYIGWLFNISNFSTNEPNTLLMDSVEQLNRGTRSLRKKPTKVQGIDVKRKYFSSREALSSFISCIIHKETDVARINPHEFISTLAIYLISSGNEALLMKLIDIVNKWDSNEEKLFSPGILETIISELKANSKKDRQVWRFVIDHAMQYAGERDRLRLMILIGSALCYLNIHDMAESCWVHVLDHVKDNASQENISAIDNILLYLNSESDEAFYARLLNELMRRVHYNEERPGALIEVLDILASSPKLFNRFRNSALDIAKKVKNISDRIRILIIITRGCANIGDHGMGAYYLQSAISLLNVLESSIYKDFCLFEIARGCCSLGLIEKALLLIRKIEQDRVKLNALICIADAYNRNGETDESYIITERIFELINKNKTVIEDKACLNALLKQISEIFVSNRHSFLERIIDVIQSVESVTKRFNILYDLFESNDAIWSTSSSYQWTNLIERCLSDYTLEEVASLEPHGNEFVICLHQIFTILWHIRSSDLTNWMRALRLCERIKTESDRAFLFASAAEYLLSLEAVNPEILHFFHSQEHTFLQNEERSQFQYILVKLCTETGDIDTAFRIIRSINEKRWCDLAAAYFVNHTSYRNTINMPDPLFIESFKLLKDSPVWFTSLLLTSLMETCHFTIDEKLEIIIKKFLRNLPT